MENGRSWTTLYNSLKWRRGGTNCGVTSGLDMIGLLASGDIPVVVVAVDVLLLLGPQRRDAGWVVLQLGGQPDVEDPRLVAGTGFELLDGFAEHLLGHGVVRVVEISELARAPHAGFHAGRQQTLIHALRAESALVGGLGDRIDEARVIRTGVDTGAAPPAQVVVDLDDAVLALPGRASRADLDARGPFAVVAQTRQKSALGIRIDAELDVGHPSAEHPGGNIVFELAGGGTGLAADALAQIDQHAPAFALESFLGQVAVFGGVGVNGTVVRELVIGAGRRERLGRVTEGVVAGLFDFGGVGADRCGGCSADRCRRDAERSAEKVSAAFGRRVFKLW